MSACLADRIYAALRGAKDGLSSPSIIRSVYADRPLPGDPKNTVRQTIHRMRRDGVDIRWTAGRYFISSRDVAIPVRLRPETTASTSRRAAEVVALLRQYEDIGLTAHDIADEMRPREDGRPVSMSRVYALLQKAVPSIAEIERVGRSYRLVEFRP